MMAKTKYIFITGGVVSSLGKGIAAASIGALLEARGLSISLIKEIKMLATIVKKMILNGTKK